MKKLESYLTVGEAAKLLDRSRQRVHQLIQTGLLHAIRQGPRAWLVSRRSAETWLKKSEVLPSRKRLHMGAVAFGAIVRRLRRAKGLKIRELARRTGIPHSTWSRGERGKQDLRKWEYLIAFAGVLEIPIDTLAAQAGRRLPSVPAKSIESGATS